MEHDSQTLLESVINRVQSIKLTNLDLYNQGQSSPTLHIVVCTPHPFNTKLGTDEGWFHSRKAERLLKVSDYLNTFCPHL